MVKKKIFCSVKFDRTLQVMILIVTILALYLIYFGIKIKRTNKISGVVCSLQKEELKRVNHYDEYKITFTLKNDTNTYIQKDIYGKCRLKEGDSVKFYVTSKKHNYYDVSISEIENRKINFIRVVLNTQVGQFCFNCIKIVGVWILLFFVIEFITNRIDKKLQKSPYYEHIKESINSKKYSKKEQKSFEYANKATDLWLKKNNHTKAEDLYKKALEQNLNNLEALTMYAELLFSLNRDDEANALYKRAYKIDKSVAEFVANHYESLNENSEHAKYWRAKVKK